MHGEYILDISSQVGHVNTAKCTELVPVVLLCKQKKTLAQDVRGLRVLVRILTWQLAG